VIDVRRFEGMGQVVEPFEVACHDTPEDLGVEGLIGMDFFRHRILTLDGIRGKVLVGP
jgi:hypothetical protein